VPLDIVHVYVVSEPRRAALSTLRYAATDTFEDTRPLYFWIHINISSYNYFLALVRWALSQGTV
jgi:hypothetical protein